MTQYTLTFKRNPDYKTVSYTVKCGLKEVLDIAGDVVDNPLETLEYNKRLGKYGVSGGEENTVVAPSMSPSMSLVPTTAYHNNWGYDKPDLRARECWCARIFQHGFDRFESQYAEENNFVADLAVSDKPHYCPIDFIPSYYYGPPEGMLSENIKNNDVTFCTSEAVVNIDNREIYNHFTKCYSEEPLREFSRTAWPLCFFWLIVLVYVFFWTNYGRRVRGCLHRNLQIFVMVCWTGIVPYGGENSSTNNNNNNNNRNTSGAHDAEQGRGTTITTTTDPTPPSGGDGNSNNNNDDTAAVAVAEFGSLRNYELLDRELRYQASRTNNEFVTWLWYSAVYSETRFNEFRRSRDRARSRRRRRVNAGDRSNDDDAGDNDSESETENGFVGRLAGSRRLDRVFWWPPSGPDGQRWAHLRNSAESQLVRDGDGNRMDTSRLCLKTKLFSLSSVAEGDNNNNNDNDGEQIGGGSAIARIRSEDEEDANDKTSGNDKDNQESTPRGGELSVIARVRSWMAFEEVSENTCSICLCEFEEGDVIGDIPCGHVFHADCLKEWLAKSNHCPVCRKTDIATHPPMGWVAAAGPRV